MTNKIKIDDGIEKVSGGGVERGVVHDSKRAVVPLTLAEKQKPTFIAGNMPFPQGDLNSPEALRSSLALPTLTNESNNDETAQKFAEGGLRAFEEQY